MQGGRDGVLATVQDQPIPRAVERQREEGSTGEGCRRSEPIPVEAVPRPGSITLKIRNGIPGGSGSLILSASAASLPAGGGCTLLLAPPHLLIPIVLNGLGETSLTGTLPPSIPPGIHVFFQFGGLDPASGNGSFTLSNGLDMLIG